MRVFDGVKAILPTSLKVALRAARKSVRYRWREHALKRAARKKMPLKIIVGAAETFQRGWYSTNEQWLDVTKEEDWVSVFPHRQILTHVVAEHVFEHLTTEEAREALRLIYSHLVIGGRLRIAVPDGNHPDPVYQAHVGVGGVGDDAADHKQLFTADALMALMQDAGLEVKHLEGYTARGDLVLEEYSPVDGYVWRSRAARGDGRIRPWGFPDSDTSLIVDGVKL